MARKIETFKRPVAGDTRDEALRQLKAHLRKQRRKGRITAFTQRGSNFVAKVAFEDDVVDLGEPAESFDDIDPMDEAPVGDPVEERLDALEEKLDRILDAVAPEGDLDPEDEVVLDEPMDDDLPPPVEEDPVDGILASKVAGRRHFTAKRVKEAGVTLSSLIREASQNFPQYEVLKVDSSQDKDNFLILMQHKG